MEDKRPQSDVNRNCIPYANYTESQKLGQSPTLDSVSVVMLHVLFWMTIEAAA